MCGLRDGVFPGVVLLSLCRLSGLPVDLAILFGPGLIPITLKVLDFVAISPIIKYANIVPNRVYCQHLECYRTTWATSLVTA